MGSVLYDCCVQTDSCVGSVEEIQAAGRKRAVVQGRDVVVIAHRGSFYALDSFCYREYCRVPHTA